MKRAAKALFAAVLAALCFVQPAAAQAPGFPTTMPPSTVYGRSAISSGPGQAIPFSVIIQLLNQTPSIWTVPQTFRLTQDVSGSWNGQRIEIQKDNSALNYAGTSAAFVLQVRDPLNLTLNQQVPSAVFQFVHTGSGPVTNGTPGSTAVSHAIWWGALFSENKTGDGSGQAVTAIGQLGAVGTGGYNELCLYCGIATNVGSTNGLIGGVEIVVVDGGFNTFMYSFAARVSRSAAGPLKAYGILGSCEGVVACDAIITLNVNSPASWVNGIDLTANTFTGFPFKSAGFSVAASGLVALTGVEGSQLQWQIAGAGQSWKASLNAGGTWYLLDTTNSIFVMTAAANGSLGFAPTSGITVGSPTGGAKGAGSINAQTCFINNVACAPAASPTFTGTVTLPAAIVAPVSTGTPAASLCLDGSNNVIKKTTAGSCV